MLTENKAYIKIMAEYSQKRSFAESERDKRIEKVYKMLPEVKKIDKQIKQLGLENMGKILADRKNSEKYNREFNDKLQRLVFERDRIINENDIEPDFDIPHYFCEQCCDTGYIDGKKCACLKQQLIDYAYDISNMRSLIEEQTFDKFDLTYYGDTKLKGLNMTERENIEDIVNISLEFCKNPENSKNLLFYGTPGLGKTFLSSSIAKEMLDKGYTVIYSGASRLFASYDDYRFGRMSEPEDFEDMLKLVYDADLLIIDDLGVEMHGPSAFQFFFDLVNERILKNKRMIISTNLTLEEISKVYTARITSRLFENFHCLRFSGKDIRTQKLMREKGHKNA
ncbi:MAG: ATP-binding protein [Clostridia bacterium]|nr:ATP-binding protein [Clostridia bacterium]